MVVAVALHMRRHAQLREKSVPSHRPGGIEKKPGVRPGGVPYDYYYLTRLYMVIEGFMCPTHNLTKISPLRFHSTETKEQR
jgi:hypothetical protein